MTERLLHFIWQMQYFNKTDLHTSANEPLQIIHTGQYNTNQGPDFLEASIRIHSTTWVGNIELHIKASDWLLHQHGEDKNYGNVILHVVWENDHPKTDDRVNGLPTLVLEDRVSKLMLQRYSDFLHSASTIPCRDSIAIASDLIWSSWKSRLVAERLTKRATMIEHYLKATNGHWEEVFWWMLARNFGETVNKDAFEAIARSLPLRTMAKHKLQIHQLECFLMGQAGLLNADFTEDYPRMLQREYRYYRNKYQFTAVYEPIHFLRMRPQNFPTIRLAQLAQLIQNSTGLFSKVKSISDIQQLKKLLAVTANDYWHYHYRFDEIAPYSPKVLGTQMINSIICNTIVPVIFAYGHVMREQVFRNKAIRWLEELPGEKNRVTREWVSLGFANSSAFDSQAYTELFQSYCSNKHCLNCAVGNAILKRSV